MIDALKEYWSLFVAAVGYVVWLVRLENRSNNNTATQEKDNAQVYRDMERLETRIDKQRAEDMDYAAKLRAEDQDSNKSYRDDVKATLGEIQRDIKQILHWGAQ